jgi:hypothetical protein
MSILNISDWKLIPSQHTVHTYIVSRALTGAAVRRSCRGTGKLPCFSFFFSLFSGWMNESVLGMTVHYIE